MSKPTNEKSSPRRRKESKHSSFRLSAKKFVKRRVNLPSSWKFLKETFRFVANNKKLFIGISATYVVVQVALVYIFGGGFDSSQAKREIEEILGVEAPAYSVAYGLANYLFISVGQRNNEVLGVYQNFISIIFMLSTIWVVRQKTAKEKFTASDIIYKSQYPLIQFIVILFILGLCFIPASISGFLYSVTIVGGIAATLLEQILWITICILLLILSLYLIIPGLLAMYIVTLPEVSPKTAYASAWKLLDGRRSGVAIRLMAGYIFVFVMGMILVMALGYFLTPISEVVFYLVTAFSMLILNIYTYKIYRAML